MIPRDILNINVTKEQITNLKKIIEKLIITSVF